jgi:uncharacterized membrane protein
MLPTLLSLIVLAVFVAGVIALYIWTRRSESSFEYETGNQTEEQANANRLGIALNVNQGNHL